MEPAFEYVNRTGRPTGAFITVLGRVLPGVQRVHEQIAPYAEAWRASNLAALDQSGPRWFVLGDSMSQGIGASNFDRGWVNQVQTRLAEDGRHYRLINLSASGARVPDVIEQQLPVLQALQPTSGDLVTLLIGSNDLIRKQYREGFAAAVSDLMPQLPDGTVVANLPQPRKAALEVNRLIAHAPNVVVADMTKGRHASWRGRLAEDHFHPNDLGYSGIADVFYEAIAGPSRSQRLPATSKNTTT